MSKAATLAALALVAAACDSGSGSPGIPTGDASSPDGAGGGSCGSFPTFDKTCAKDADCAYATHQVAPCCSALQAIGLNVTQKVAFQQAEQSCDWGHCTDSDSGASTSCGDQSIQADDGKSVGGGLAGGTLVVACSSSKCTTLVK